MADIVTVNSVTELHDLLGLEPPKHPLISILELDKRLRDFNFGAASYVLGLYQVSLKEGDCGELIYGRSVYDYDKGSIVCTEPGQILSLKDSQSASATGGWALLFHPDIIRSSQLGQHISGYPFFSYESTEALHVSKEEKENLSEIVRKIEDEYTQRVDRHSQKLIVSNIEVLLDYCTRYYDRQFHFRSDVIADIVMQFDGYLRKYIDAGELENYGIPTVSSMGKALNLSGAYLSELMKRETGRGAQQHIQERIIEQAKTKLLGTPDQVSQIAYSLGFEYPQHFSKVFKRHTGISPINYRKVH